VCARERERESAPIAIPLQSVYIVVYLSVSLGSYGPLHASKTVNLFLSASVSFSLPLCTAIRVNSSRRQTDRAFAESCRPQNNLSSQFSPLLPSSVVDLDDGVTNTYYIHWVYIRCIKYVYIVWIDCRTRRPDAHDLYLYDYTGYGENNIIVDNNIFTRSLYLRWSTNNTYFSSVRSIILLYAFD